MEHRDVFDLCKKVAVAYGYHRKTNISEHVFYADPLGCDFEIHYSGAMAVESDKSRQMVRAYLGGREVYAWSESLSLSQYDEIYAPGCWEELLSKLEKCELDSTLGEPMAITHSLVESCKREAMRNRKFFDKHVEQCVKIAKDSRPVMRDRGQSYHVVKVVGEKLVEIDFSEDIFSGNEVFLEVDGKKIFVYRWGREDDVQGSLNEKGKIFDDGAWWRDIWWKFLNSRY